MPQNKRRFGKEDVAMQKKKKEIPNIVCDCGYQNKPEMVKRYGTCRLCGKTLDKKAKYEYEMFVRLHLWRNKKR